MFESLRRIDLNLLVVFDALLGERSVSKAAVRLNMTQPAVSNALNRLRERFSDVLFTRSANGMIPTTRALEMAEPIREALGKVDSLLTPPKFDAANTSRTFRLALSDQAATIILPKLAFHLAAIAPGIDIRMEPKTLPAVPGLLDRNQIDMAIGIFPNLHDRFKSTVLYSDRFVCLLRKDHRFARSKVTLKRLVELKHVALQAVPAASALISQILSTHNLSRRVVLTVNQCITIPEIIAETDFTACILEKTADYLMKGRHDLVKKNVPIEPFEISLVWPVELDQSSAHIWLRTQLIDIVKKAKSLS